MITNILLDFIFSKVALALYIISFYKAKVGYNYIKNLILKYKRLSII